MSQLGLTNEADYVPQTRENAAYSLAACPDCRQLVSPRAASCPHCGSPFHITTRQQPTLGRIAGGVILGYLGILLINVVLFFVVMIFFAGMLGGALNKTLPNRTPTSTYA